MIRYLFRRTILHWSLVALGVFLALIASSQVAGLPLADSSGVPVDLDPASATLSVGETVTLSIQVGASSSQPVDTVQVYLDFDSTLLQVVDSNGDPATQVTLGPILQPGGLWKDVLLNAVDNQAGRVVVAGGKGLEGTDATEEFVLATVRFKALGVAPETLVAFDTEAPEKTRAVFQGTEVTGAAIGATLAITGPGCVPPASGDWVIESSCTMSGQQIAAQNVVVQPGVTLTIDSWASLDIDFSNHHLRIKDGAQVVIRDEGKIH